MDYNVVSYGWNASGQISFSTLFAPMPINKMGYKDGELMSVTWCADFSGTHKFHIYKHDTHSGVAFRQRDMAIMDCDGTTNYGYGFITPEEITTCVNKVGNLIQNTLSDFMKDYIMRGSSSSMDESNNLSKLIESLKKWGFQLDN